MERIAIKHFLLAYLIPDLADLSNVKCKTLLLPSGIDTCPYCHQREALFDIALKLQLDKKEFEVFRFSFCHSQGSSRRCLFDNVLREKFILAVTLPCPSREASIWDGGLTAERQNAIYCCETSPVKRVVAFPQGGWVPNGFFIASLDSLLRKALWTPGTYLGSESMESLYL